MSHACYICNFEPVADGEGAECPHCHRLQYGPMCPHCGQNAPTIIRGMKVYCSACNTVRGPLAGGMPLNLTGQPQKVGGALARFAGWGTILGGVALAALALLIATMLSLPTAGAIVALIIAAVGATAGGLMLSSGKKLMARGENSFVVAREQAVLSLAGHRGGSLTASDVAAALNIPAAEADALLTKMAADGTRVGVEVDGAGGVHYVFREARLAPSSGAPTGVRVDARSGVASQPAQGQSDAEAVKAQVDREWEQMQKNRRPGR